MARWKSTHIVNKNFAYGDPVIQYKKGAEVRLKEDCAKFAENTGCATSLNPVQRTYNVDPLELNND